MRKTVAIVGSSVVAAAAAVFAVVAATSGPPDARRGPAPALSWTVQASGTDAGLRGISAVDDRTAWASGTRGTVLRTVDGGATWTLLPVPGAEATDFRDVEAFGPDEAVVMGIDRPARIFRTTDGGRTWTRTWFDDSPGVFLDGLAFSDGGRGMAVGDPMDGRFLLLTTDDRGASWRPWPAASRPPAAEGEAAFAASGTSLTLLGRDRMWLGTGGAVSRVWRSTDGGRGWEAVPSALAEGAPSKGAFSVAFLDLRRGIVVGGDYRAESESAGNAAVSEDGGRTWTPATDQRPGGYREAVAFVPGTRPPVAVTVGPSGSDFSLDLGRTWAPIETPAGLHALAFAKKGRAGWAVGRNGLIARLDLARRDRD